MTTGFKVTCTKGDGKTYWVNLGVDVLAGKTAEQVYAMATRTAVIDVQNRKDSLLRKANGAVDIEDMLHEFGYANATAEPYVAKPSTTKVTEADIRNAVASGKLTKKQLMAMVAELE
jgi:phage tail tape-measure protein